MSLLIYAEQVTERVQYALQLVFSDILKIEFEITSDPQKMLTSDSAKLNYSSRQLGDECFIYAEFLLFEKGIRPFEISTGVFENIKTLFHHERIESDLPFDPFAAAFYLASRYEEYVSFVPDKHGRFSAENSVAFKNHFLEIPVVNHYAIFIRDLIQKKYPQFIFPAVKFQFQLTYDIDVAYAYLGRNIFRTGGGCARDLLKLNAKSLLKRLQVLSKKVKDPFDTYDYQKLIHEKFGLNPVYFFLVANRDAYDNNIDYKNEKFQKLIRDIAVSYEVGIHAGYAAASHEDLLKKEIGRLHEISGQTIVRNRQHFLKMKLPQSYETLLRQGIQKDHTMGYASHSGFRASVAVPFHWYNLSAEKTTSLLIHPIAAMDATFLYYREQSAGEAREAVKEIIQHTKKVNGYFQLIAHNDLISEEGPFPSWRNAFEEVIAFAVG